MSEPRIVAFLTVANGVTIVASDHVTRIDEFKHDPRLAPTPREGDRVPATRIHDDGGGSVDVFGTAPKVASQIWGSDGS